MPHLIRGLDLPSCEIRSNIIDTLTVVASSDGIHGPTQEHATTLVSIVLKNALPQEITSVVRIDYELLTSIYFIDLISTHSFFCYI